MKTIIFACVRNAGRSQMAAAFFNKLADPAKVRALSAGTTPGDRVHPEVVAVMQEEGIDLSGARPQKLTSELAAEAQLLITMGCGDECPYVPESGGTTGHWTTRRGSRSNASAPFATTFALASRRWSFRGREIGGQPRSGHRVSPARGRLPRDPESDL